MFLGGTLFLAPGIFWGRPLGKSIVGALVILDGGVPYRDFWAMYAPGHYYLLAGLYALFGRQLIVQGAAAVLLRAASAGVFCLILRRIGSTTAVALTLSTVFVGMFWSAGIELRAYDPALLLLLVAIDQIIAFFRDGNLRKLVWAGLFTGFAAWFKHDVAAYAAAGMAIGIVVSRYANVDGGRPSWLQTRRAAVAFGGTALSIVTLGALGLLSVAGSDAWQDLIVFPSTTFLALGMETFPPLLPPLHRVLDILQEPGNFVTARQAFAGLAEWILCYLPTFAFFLGLWAALRRTDPPAAANRATIFVCLACLALFWSATHVRHNTNLYTMAIFSFLLGALVWQGLSSLTTWKRPLRRLVLVAFAIYTLGLALAPAEQLFRIGLELRDSRMLGLPGFAGVRVSGLDYAAYTTVHEVVQEQTTEDERIYSGVARHEAIVISDPLIYAVAGRLPCCRYTELHGGVTDRLSIQREIIDGLEAKDVRIVVLWRFGWSDSVLDLRRDALRETTPDGGSTLLNEYIAEHYEPITEAGEYVVLRRKPGRTR